MIIDCLNAASKQLVYVAPVANWKPTMMRVSLRRPDVQVKPDSNLRPVYAFDFGSYFDDNQSPIDWIPIWGSEYSEDLGSSVYKNLPTGFALTKMAQYVTKSLVYTVELAFSPLIPEATAITTPYVGGDTPPYAPSPVSWSAEYAIYTATVLPAYALYSVSSVPDSLETFRLGPLLPSKIGFSCDEGNSVQVRIGLQGVRYRQNSQELPVLAPEQYEDVYRSANFLDCYCNIGSNRVSSIFSAIDARIVSMSLDINQEYEFVFPAQNKDTAASSDNVGARYAGLNSREVSGKIQILAKDPRMDPMKNPELTMYFGGPFYFKMRNIRWQNPTMDIKIDQGYIHTYKFIALADRTAHIKSTYDLSSCSSEFVLGE